MVYKPMAKLASYVPSFLCGLIGGVVFELIPYAAGYLVPGSDPYRFLEEMTSAHGFDPVVSYFSAVLVFSFIIFVIFLFTPFAAKSGEKGIRKALFYLVSFIAWDFGMIVAVGLWAIGLIVLFQFGHPSFL